MTNRELAALKYSQYLMADFNHIMGRSAMPVATDYGFNGGNMITVNGEAFNVNDIAPRTAPIHAGF